MCLFKGKEGGSFIELFYSKGRKEVHSMCYTIQIEVRWFIHWVRLFKGKEGGLFNRLHYSKGRKVVGLLNYTIYRDGRWFIH